MQTRGTGWIPAPGGHGWGLGSRSPGAQPLQEWPWLVDNSYGRSCLGVPECLLSTGPGLCRWPQGWRGSFRGVRSGRLPQTRGDEMYPVLQAKSIGKVYLRGTVPVQALREVDLEVRSGEFLAIMGPSGSGKSTLLHILGALDEPTAGEIYFQGKRRPD